ncbi:MAG: hypothetical protein GOVbin1807_175 [Prokaryotic dsDNA virus sp.]|nr:MAG: hypothetical protein GOVbin1807_175 [Prokaryotic dsDNA virus sp.]
MKYKKISFDWDNTIAMSYMIDSEEDSELPIYNFQGYNIDIIEKIKEYHSQGVELYIVTSRKRSLEEYYPEDSVEFQLKRLKLDHIFPSVRVHYTEGDLKAKTLRQLGIELHHDDSMEEILECQRYGIEVLSSLKSYKDSNIVTKGIITDIHNSILLLRRTDEGTKWDIPGGHIKNIEVERGLKGIADGYEREVAEETGLIVPQSRLIHQYTHTWKGEDMDMHILWTDYAVEEPPVDLFVQDFQENSEFVWAQEEDLHIYMANMTEVASIAIQFYLDNTDNPEIMEGKYLPSQSQSWAKMKKKLTEIKKPQITNVSEERERKKKELRLKLSKILAKTTKSSSKGKRGGNILDILNDMDSILKGNPMINASQEEKDLYFAETLSKFMKDSNGNPFEQVKIKGEGYGYYYSMSDKKTILVPRAGEYYLISNKADHKGRLRLYSHYKFTTGIVILVPEDEIERIGWN